MSGVRLQQLVHSGMLTPGSQLVFRSQVGSLGEDGTIWSEEMKQRFDSPSAWATAVCRWGRNTMSASNGWSSVRTESGEKLDAFRQRFLAGSNTTTTTLPGQSVPEDGRASLTNIATAAQAPKAEATPSTPPKQAQAETGSAKKKRSSPTGSEGAKKRTKADSPVGGSTGKTSGGNSNSKKAGGSDNSLSEDKLQPGNGIAMTDHVHMAICIAVEPDFGNGTEVCLSCGGFVVDIENGVFCSHCGECYHGACIYPGFKLTPRDSLDRGWRCMNCILCENCRSPQPEDKLLVCDRCDKGFHTMCLKRPLDDIPLGIWLCERCAECAHCHRHDPGPNPLDHWTHDGTLCFHCGELKDKGNICPVCEKFYEDDDDSPMVSCEDCNKWIHAACDNMTEEEYQIFSTTDEKYYCPQCRKDKLNLDSVIPDEVNGINWRKLRVGDQVDVFDTRGMRCAAEITERADISYDPLQSTFSIHYIGWSSKFDETITLAQAFKRMFKHEEDALTDRSQYSRRISSVRAIPEGTVIPEAPVFIKGMGLLKSMVSRKALAPSEKKGMPLTPPSSSQDEPMDGLTQHHQHILQLEDSTNAGKIIPTPLPSADHRVCRLCNLRETFSGQIAAPTGPVSSSSSSASSSSSSSSSSSTAVGNASFPPKPADIGSFIYVGECNAWAHVSCVLWSPEVYEGEDGELVNASAALIRGKQMKCTKCNRSGATLGCCASNCHSTYHFGCALQEKCGLFEDKRIFCQRHLAKGRTESVEITDFSLIQKRTYAKGALLNFDPKTSLIRCGSATLRSLGQITNATIKTAEKSQQLVPVGLTVVRIYWSCHKPYQRTRYICKVASLDPPEYEMIPEDDEQLVFRGASPKDVWLQLFAKINHLRAQNRLPALFLHDDSFSLTFFGLSNPPMVCAIERLPGSGNAVRKGYHLQFARSSEAKVVNIATSQPPQPPRENSSGCVRTEPIPRRKQRNHDAKFKFLAFGGVSSLDTDSSALTTEQQQQQGSTNVKEVTGPGRVILFSLAMQYRQMRANKQAVVVGHSSIHSKGLFANKTFDKDDMVIEYVGEVIGQKVADRRELEYDNKGLGTYMFRLDHDRIVDATFCGNAARFINHSCQPNCYARTVAVDGHKHVIIFSMRRIECTEELTYDYKFAEEETKLVCMCGAPNCRGTMN